MIITPHLFEAHPQCPTKCWLRYIGEAVSGNEYADWAVKQNVSYRDAGIKRILEGLRGEEYVIAPPEPVSLRGATWRIAVDLVVRTARLQSCLHAVQRLAADLPGKPAPFVPIRFICANKLTRDDRLLLAFDALVLSETLGREVSHGRIIHGDDHKTLKVNTSALSGEVRKRIGDIGAQLSASSSPDLVLNRHCAECEFQAHCRRMAAERDDLSLLAGMAAKERKRYHDKGIFTVTQLSHTFRPRRRPKRLRDRGERYHHALKALAIREKKIHVVGSPEVKIEGTPVGLDVEGLPDRDFYYLIGARIGDGNSVVQHSLWADRPEDEETIWGEFLALFSRVENPVLIHYGSFETDFLKRMRVRYDGADDDSPAALDIRNSRNLLSLIFGQIYFPCYSNGLKDVARFLGFDWSEPNAAGIQTVVWRTEWERSHDDSLKRKLITYNAQDCEALSRVTQCLQSCFRGQGTSLDNHVDDVVSVDSLSGGTSLTFRKNQFQLAEMEEINQAAYWDYQRERVLLRSSPRLSRVASTSSKRPRARPRVNKAMHLPAPQSCPRCGGSKLYKHQRATKDVIDARFGLSGVKRWITRYHFYRYRCPSCHAVFHNANRPWGNEKFGHNLRALSVYLNIDLRVPQERVAIHSVSCKCA